VEAIRKTHHADVAKATGVHSFNDAISVPDFPVSGCQLNLPVYPLPTHGDGERVTEHEVEPAAVEI
jgi:hypothetical protein